LAFRSRLEIKMTSAYVEGVQKHYLALGGIERLRSFLYEVGQQGQNQELSEAVVTQLASGFRQDVQTESMFEMLEDSPLDPETKLVYAIEDELGLLSVNQSDSAVWEKLPPVDRRLRSALLDWIDQDNDVNPDGAESDFYRQRMGLLRVKNKSVELLPELYFIRDADRRRYQGGVRWYCSVDDEDDSITEGLGLAELFTVYGDGHLNINTVPETILAALPGIGEQAARAIVQYRQTMSQSRKPAFEKSQDFSSEEFLHATGLVAPQPALLEQYCCFASQHYRVYSQIRKADGSFCCLMGTVRQTSEGPQLLFVEEVL
ncbi:MAG: general secretion pathway protein GspK, partial [Desulfobacterales bacterium]|nr:general secretion pathway protein GspK [Desulfobacterales bacterium]